MGKGGKGKRGREKSEVRTGIKSTALFVTKAAAAAKEQLMTWNYAGNRHSQTSFKPTD